MKKLFLALGVIVLLFSASGANSQSMENKFSQMLSQKPAVNDSLFIKSWELIKKLYLDSILISDDSVRQMWQNLKIACQEKPLAHDSLVYAAVNRLVAMSKPDPYTCFLTPEEVEYFFGGSSEEYAGIGINLKRLENLAPPVVAFVRPDGPARKAGLKMGDIIEKIDEQKTKGLSGQEIIGLLRGSESAAVNLTISRQKKILNFTVGREKMKSRKVYAELIDQVAYFKIVNFSEAAYIEFVTAAKLAFKKDCRGIIIDLRDNPGGRVYEASAIVRGWIEGLVTTLKYKEGAEKLETGSSVKPFTSLLHLPTVILINSETASAAEIMAGALRDHGIATLLGETTFGKGCGQAVIVFGDGSMLRITSFLWETPNGECVMGKGISPDVKVDFTDKDLVDGHDTQLEEALKIIKTKGAKSNIIDLDAKVELKRLDIFKK